MAVDFSRLRRANAQNRRSWHGGAFIVESLVLLVFLMAALAVAIQLMGEAHQHGADADRLSSAIILASNDAEAFAANPTPDDAASSFAAVDGDLVEATEVDAPADGNVYEVSRTVDARDEAAGTLYEARITVTCDGETVYELATSRYVPTKEVAR